VPVRTPKRKRPLPRKFAGDVAQEHLDHCATRVSYVGSPEHKSAPSFAGPPKLRSDASKCPTHLRNADEITDWVAGAIQRGQVSQDPGPDGFPRYVWAYELDTWFEGRLVNETQGTYKGYPLSDDQVPHALKQRRERE
jgi:hypothetical protein